jgi:glycerol-3-phosphate acyltransferase PlsY
MNETTALVILMVLAYLLGSLSPSVWISKGYFGFDIRSKGSGNAGATNTFRVLGTKVGILVLFLDIIKGLTAASLPFFLGTSEPGSERFMNQQLLCGVLAVVGHIFPVYEHFKGGKGIATLLGMVVAIFYPLALICIGVFIIVLLVTRYVSLSSMLAVIAFPVCAYFVFHIPSTWVIVFGLAASFLVIWTHQANIKRLLDGTESKANLFKSKG